MAKFQLAFRMKKPDDVTGGGTGGEVPSSVVDWSEFNPGPTGPFPDFTNYSDLQVVLTSDGMATSMGMELENWKFMSLDAYGPITLFGKKNDGQFGGEAAASCPIYFESEPLTWNGNENFGPQGQTFIIRLVPETIFTAVTEGVEEWYENRMCDEGADWRFGQLKDFGDRIMWSLEIPQGSSHSLVNRNEGFDESDYGEYAGFAKQTLFGNLEILKYCFQELEPPLDNGPWTVKQYHKGLARSINTSPYNVSTPSIN